MTIEETILRPEQPGEEAAIAALVTAAFGRDDEARLVKRLRAADALTTSLVAAAAGEIVGHVALSPVEIDGMSGRGRWLGLAPLAVLPGHQREGIGARLVAQAGKTGAMAGATAIFVLGDPDYYGRLGFEEAGPLGWRCIYDAPSAAFRVVLLGDTAGLPPPGTVRYHAAFGAL